MLCNVYPDWSILAPTGPLCRRTQWWDRYANICTWTPVWRSRVSNSGQAEICPRTIRWALRLRKPWFDSKNRNEPCVVGTAVVLSKTSEYEKRATPSLSNAVCNETSRYDNERLNENSITITFVNFQRARRRYSIYVTPLGSDDSWWWYSTGQTPGVISRYLYHSRRRRRPSVFALRSAESRDVSSEVGDNRTLFRNSVLHYYIIIQYCKCQGTRCVLVGYGKLKFCGRYRITHVPMTDVRCSRINIHH